MGDLLDKAVGLLPRLKLYAAIAALWTLSLAVTYCTGRGDGKDAEKAAQAKAQVIAERKARAADGEARDVVAETRGKVEAQNERARDAAKDSDDPLRDGLEALR